MSLDGATLRYVRRELLPLLGARVDKIYQPAREEIVVTLRLLGGEKRAEKLFFSANSANARVCVTEKEFENPQSPPMFCMLLRKHLGGGKLVDIRQDGLERILYFDFECLSEIGDIVTNTLAAEIMGRSSNIILLRGGRVVDSVRRVAEGNRRILPNIVYETPPRPQRLNFFETDARDILKAVCQSHERGAKALTAALEGISPVFARECAFYVSGDADACFDALSDEEEKRFLQFFENAKSGGKFTELFDENGERKDFCFVDIKQYEGLYKAKYFDGANALLDDFFGAKDPRAASRSKDLLKLIMTRIERVSRKIELQKKELAECAKKEELKKTGDILNANLYKLEKGMKSALLDDIYGGEKREISLSPRLSPAQNAQKYYNDYRKLCNAEKMLTKLIAEGERELLYLDSVLDLAQRAKGDAELSEIKSELFEQGYLRGDKNEKKRQKPSKPQEFLSSDGFVILVGKNNRQNDELTLKTAKAHDIWLHTQNIAGSHVIIKTEGKTPPESTIFEAARLAAFHSKARDSANVPVDYTAVKFVKKPAGAKPGMVIFTNNRTLFVEPREI